MPLKNLGGKALKNIEPVNQQRKKTVSKEEDDISEDIKLINGENFTSSRKIVISPSDDFARDMEEFNINNYDEEYIDLAW